MPEEQALARVGNKTRTDEHCNSPFPRPGTYFLTSNLPFDPNGTRADAAWPPPYDEALSPPWLGWQEWDWDARTWGPETPRDAEPASSDHDGELTEEHLRQLIANEKLMVAVEAGDRELAESLCAAGAEVNFYDSEFAKCCPVHIAAMLDDAEVLALLLRVSE